MRILPKGSKFFHAPWRLGRAFIAGGVLLAIGLLGLLSQATGRVGHGRSSVGDANKGIDNALDRLFSTPVAYADAVGRGSSDGCGCWSSQSSASAASSGSGGSAGSDASGGSAG